MVADLLMSIVYIILAMVVLAELLVFISVKLAAARFQWLITPESKRPHLPKKVVEHFFNKSFDSELGWAPKAGSSGEDITELGVKTYHIDEKGRRFSPAYSDMPSKVAVFGDSFSFGRLVNDDETWPYALSKLVKSHVPNYSVGGYGLDQALLRLKREIKTIDSNIILMCVVPETIARIHSYWRHYFEYGNTLAFKPRFAIDNERLKFYELFIKDQESFEKIEENEEYIQRVDYFYKYKFSKNILCFPYVYRLWKTRRQNFPILKQVVIGLITGRSEKYRKKAFKQVLRNNAKYTAEMYNDDKTKLLFSRLVDEFVALCHEHDKKPVLVVTPQPVDMERLNSGFSDYSEFIAQLSEKLEVCDLTSLFVGNKNVAEWYLEGELGPHLSMKGNNEVAEYIFNNAI
jgi:hypothetical protein